jgi:hypothetical protein
MKLISIIVGFIFLASVQLNAQQFGGFPPSVKWHQINTDTARIIFPAAVDSQAQDIAAIIHRTIPQRSNSLGNNVRKINIVMHNNTTLANGYVMLGPFRSEYYLIPGSDIFEFGANTWYKELAAHEFRHVLQFSNFNKGLSKFGSIVFGQEGQALFNAIAIPDWFWEGDAVHAETSLTTQGRGRTPFFFNGYKSLWREGRNYSWMKLRSGSLKDYVPDHYNLGYLLVNYGYLKYGNDFWKKVTEDAVAYKGLIYPFQQAIKRYSGVNYKTFRQNALDYYSHEVSRKRTDSVKRAVVTNYYFPQYISDDSLLYLKKSYQTLPAFYVKDKTGEHKLRLKNISTEDWFSYRNGVIAYTAYETNPRWSLIDYSSIYLYNIHTGEQTKITHKAKYYTPDISPSGNKIITVSVDDKTQTTLQVLDNSGKILEIIQPVGHSNFVHPRFIDENTIVVTERLPDATMQMSRVDLLTGGKEILIPSTSALIGYPFPYNGYIYFVSSVAGMDDIYSLRISDKKIFQTVSGVTGKYYPSIYKDSLLWSAFTSNGLAILKKQIDNNTNQVNPALWKEVVLPYPVANAETSFNATANIARRFPESRYRQGAHLFNFHSWRPDYTDPEFTLSLFSDNMLNTFTNEIYYRYNQNETSHTIGFNSSYGAWFPVINAGVDYNMGRSVATSTRQYELNSFEGKIGFNIPLDFTSGRMHRFFNVGSNFIYNHTFSTQQSKDFYKSNVEYLHHFIRWAHYLPQAIQHIYPKFGYTLSGDLRHLINSNFGGGLLQSSQLLAGAQLFLPSIKNHNIVLSAAYQRVDTNSVIFSNRFSMSRGYADYYYKKMWRVSGNYHFPIAYPDFGFANIIFLQRIRGNIFYDYARVDTSHYFSSPRVNASLRSTGAEIYFDTKLWNELPVSIGIRGSYLLDNGRSPDDRRGNVWFELILPASLIPN